MWLMLMKRDKNTNIPWANGIFDETILIDIWIFTNKLVENGAWARASEIESEKCPGPGINIYIELWLDVCIYQ